jgi:hypothetical protein
MIFEELTPDQLKARLDDYERSRVRVERDLFRQKRQLVEDHAAERRHALAAQARVAGVLDRLSPAASLGFLASEMAGTGPSTLARWESLVRAHQTSLEEALFDRTAGIEVVFDDGRWRNPTPREGDVEVPGYAELPQFGYRAAGLGDSLRAATPDFALLVLYNLLVLGGAALLFSRYDVR